MIKPSSLYRIGAIIVPYITFLIFIINCVASFTWLRSLLILFNVFSRFINFVILFTLFDIISQFDMMCLVTPIFSIEVRILIPPILSNMFLI